MAPMLVSIDRAGRIVIPKEVRDRLDLTPDTELELQVLGHLIQIERPRRAVRRLQWTTEGRPYFPADESSRQISDLDVQRVRDAEQR